MSQIDAAHGRVVHTYPVGEQPTALARGDGRVWVADTGSGQVSVITPGVAKPSTYRTGGRPDAVTWAAASWIGSAASAAPHRGGTLRVWLPPGSGSVDPADANGLVIPYTNDGLVAYRHVGGAAGMTLVPDLATRLPKPSSGGRVYRFHLRSGIRYSDGRLVRASDERLALERDFRVRSWNVFDHPSAASLGDFDALAGARRCQADPGRCDLRRGIVTNNATGTITFHLTRPDPDFLYQLAQLEASLIPSADHRSGRLAATGPYMVARARSGRIILTRNPHFRSWSSQARPPAFADRIVLTEQATPHGVLRGQGADVLQAIQPTPELATIARAHRGRVVVSNEGAHWWMALNTRVAPFNHLLARRAVEIAVDRKALAAAQIGGSVFWRADCHIIPDGTLPHAPPCPYAAPDLARAVRLVAESGTKGEHVTVWSFDPYYGRFAVYFAGLLRRLGYPPTLTSPMAIPSRTTSTTSRTRGSAPRSISRPGASSTRSDHRRWEGSSPVPRSCPTLWPTPTRPGCAIPVSTGRSAQLPQPRTHPTPSRPERGAESTTP